MAQAESTKWAVQAPDGKVIQFPNEFTDADVSREMGKLYPQAPPPNSAQRYSEITMGTQHPLDELRAEGKNIIAHPKEAAIGAAQSLGETLGIPKDFWAHPGDQYQNIGGTGIPGMIFGENGLIKSPLKFSENFTGGRQLSEDMRSGNYKAIPGDIAGGITNLALAKKPAEAGGAALADTAKNAKAGIADAIRTPDNKLTPVANVASRVGTAALGYGLGVPIGESSIAGGVFGRSLGDALLPKRAPSPNFFGGAYEPPEVYPGASLPSTGDFYMNRGADFMKRGVQEDILARRSAASAKANAPQPELGSPENPGFYAKLPTRMPKPAAVAPIKTSPFGNATASNALNADITIPQAGAYSPPSANVPGLTRSPYAPPEVSAPTLESSKANVVRLPEPREPLPGENPNYNASIPRARLLDLGRQGRPGAGDQLRNIGKTVLYVPPEGYPGPRGAYDPPDAQYSRTGGAEGPYSPPSYAYRVHDANVGPEEFDLDRSHAHATTSPEEAVEYQSSRNPGTPQTISKNDLGGLREGVDYDLIDGPRGNKWVRFKTPRAKGEFSPHE